MSDSKLEASFYAQVVASGLPPPPEREFIFCNRDFRLDFAWPPLKVYVEVQGGTWVIGGHSSGTGIERDCFKRNLATLSGWRGLDITSNMLKSKPGRESRAIEMLRILIRDASV